MNGAAADATKSLGTAIMDYYHHSFFLDLIPDFFADYV